MASFCSGCGFPQGANVTFCPNCGARQQGAASAAPASQYQPAAAPVAPAKTGSALKIVLVLAGLVVFAGIAMVAGLFYVGHRVKEAVVDKAKAYGVELPRDSPASTATARVRLPKSCDLLSKEEVAGLVGEPIERFEPQQEGCWYYGPAGLGTKLANEQAAGLINAVRAPGPNNGADALAALQQMQNTVGAGEQIGNNGAEVPLLMVMVDPDGKAQMTALGIAKGLFSGIAKGSGAPDLGIGTEVPGLGDRAMRAPKLGLNVLKGELLVRVIAGPIPDPDTKTVNVARAVLKKL